MRDSQILSVVNAINRVMKEDTIEVSEKTQKLIEKTDEEVIRELSKYVYEHFNDNTELLEYFLSLICNINLSIAPNAKFLMEELKKQYLNAKPDASLVENHNMITKYFTELVDAFNREGIDYCVVGSVPCFLQAGVPLFRYHDDIDVMVNEDDLSKVHDIVEGLGYIYSDFRFPTPFIYDNMQKNMPPHLVMAQGPGEFHLGFFTFRREQDNSITTTDYKQRKKDDVVIVDRIDRHYNLAATGLRFGNVCQVNGVLARVCSPEHVYELKGCTKRPKDVTDMEVLEPYIDKEKLKEIRRQSNTKVVVKNVIPEDQMVM